LRSVEVTKHRLPARPSCSIYDGTRPYATGRWLTLLCDGTLRCSQLLAWEEKTVEKIMRVA